VPDYELLRRIGGGSYGEVWLGRSVLGTWRAVKIVHRSSFDHERPFEREFEGIQKFEPISRAHDSQVDILHVGKGDGCFYYVMELADDANALVAAEVTRLTSNRGENARPHPSPLPQGEGESSSARRQAGTLENFERRRAAVPSPGGEGQGEGGPTSIPKPDSQSLLTSAATYQPRTLKLDLQRRGRLPPNDCVQIGLALTTALSHLHEHGLVHRDVKPSNIIFVDGRARLADIGLVTSIDATRSFVGTEGYLPPEGAGTPQADLYSLGKVLYEMSTGQDRRHFPALPPDVAQLPDARELAELNAVVVKACQFDARLRYHSAAEMQADLALLQRGQSVMRKRAVKRRLAFARRITLAAAVLTLLAAGVWLLAARFNISTRQSLKGHKPNSIPSPSSPSSTTANTARTSIWPTPSPTRR
jgi:serine/threonine protein kinase